MDQVSVQRPAPPPPPPSAHTNPHLQVRHRSRRLADENEAIHAHLSAKQYPAKSKPNASLKQKSITHKDSRRSALSTVTNTSKSIASQSVSKPALVVVGDKNRVANSNTSIPHINNNNNNNNNSIVNTNSSSSSSTVNQFRQHSQNRSKHRVWVESDTTNQNYVYNADEDEELDEEDEDEEEEEDDDEDEYETEYQQQYEAEDEYDDEMEFAEDFDEDDYEDQQIHGEVSSNQIASSSSISTTATLTSTSSTHTNSNHNNNNALSGHSANPSYDDAHNASFSDDTELEDEYEETESPSTEPLLVSETISDPSTITIEIPAYRFNVAGPRPSVNRHALHPIWTPEVHEDLALIERKYSNMPGIFDENDEDTTDISMVAEYSNEIFEHMRHLEIKYLPDCGYMERQAELDWQKRRILIDWLVRVHDHCHLLPETLFLTVNYIDRFLSVKVVGQSKLQLVGIVALFLAAKYEEISCPSVQEIAYLVDNEYAIEEILRAERYMIELLQFNMGAPGPMSFLRRSSKADDYDSDTRTLAKYLVELTIMDERFVSSPSSWLASAAHCLSRRILNRSGNAFSDNNSDDEVETNSSSNTYYWTDLHAYFSGYTEEQLRPCMEVMIDCCRVATRHHNSIYRKYSEPRFKWVSLHVTEWIANNF